MKSLIDKYADKLVAAGLVEPGVPLIGGLDAELIWNRDDPVCSVLEEVFAGLNINSLLFAPPAEPYRTILEDLCQTQGDTITPQDCETRTFMHDFPVIRSLDATTLIARLKQRKSVIIAEHGIVTWGAVSPEQAFIFYSSVCFAAFVKFFADHWAAQRQGRITSTRQRTFDRVMAQLNPLPEQPPILARGPFVDEEQVYAALAQAGRCTVQYGLVDSFFGNISYLFRDRLYISQTASSLDELEGCIDACPLDGSSCAGLTASSELTAHQDIVTRTGRRAVLHGHPKFAVICSLLCDKPHCPQQGLCHIKCREDRRVGDIPIVPGEVGTGPHGLCHTLPPAIQGQRGAIVYGHGLFTTGPDDFNTAFANLLSIEKMCREYYIKAIQ